MTWPFDHPWTFLGLLILGWVSLYESVAVWSQRRRWTHRLQTLSQIAERNGLDHRWVPAFWVVAVLSVLVLLYDHFWIHGGLL